MLTKHIPQLCPGKSVRLLILRGSQWADSEVRSPWSWSPGLSHLCRHVWALIKTRAEVLTFSWFYSFKIYQVINSNYTLSKYIYINMYILFPHSNSHCDWQTVTLSVSSVKVSRFRSFPAHIYCFVLKFAGNQRDTFWQSRCFSASHVRMLSVPVCFTTTVHITHLRSHF